MVAEQDEESDSPESKRLHKSKQFWHQMKLLMDRMFQQEKRGGNVQTDKSKRGNLEEKHFRRMSNFGGDISQLRLWMLNLGVAI
eukprot:3690400-Karenia_brevis.AAC.1